MLNYFKSVIAISLILILVLAIVLSITYWGYDADKYRGYISATGVIQSETSKKVWLLKERLLIIKGPGNKTLYKKLYLWDFLKYRMNVPVKILLKGDTVQLDHYMYKYTASTVGAAFILIIWALSMLLRTTVCIKRVIAFYFFKP